MITENKVVNELVSAAEALYKNVGKENWGATCERINLIERIVKRIRRAEKKDKPKGAGSL
jgi:hypothetical protein